MKTRRVFALMAAILLLLTIFVACADNDNIIIRDPEKTEVETTEITFFGGKADEINLIAIENAMRAFMDQNPKISVSYECVKGDGYWNALKLRYNADLANNFEYGILDDIVMVNQENVLNMGDDLLDLTNVINLDMFSDSVKAQVVQNGQAKFIPLNWSSFCMYVNRDLLADNGWSVPKNLEELESVCKAFIAKFGKVPIICNKTNSLRTVVEACGFYGRDMDIDAINANPTVLADYLEEGLNLVEKMKNDGWIKADEVLETAATSDDIGEFVKGERPFLITGGWVSLRIKDAMKKAEKSFDFEMHPYPVKKDCSVLLINVNTCISINAHSKNLEAAKTFMAHFINPDAIWEYCDTQCCFSPLKNETRDPSEPSIAPTKEYYSNGKAVIGADYRLLVPIDKYLTDCTNLILAGASAAEAKAALLDMLGGTHTL